MDKSNNGRQPGRPKNTGRHQAEDAQLLERIAERRLDDAHKPLAQIITELVDVERDTGGVRRLQRAFKTRGNALMEAARNRRQQQRLEEFRNGALRFINGFQRASGTFLERFEAWSRSPDGQRAAEFCNRFQQAAQSPEMQKWQALSKPLFPRA